MYSINGTKIQLTRGDTLKVQISLTQGGEPYTPQSGDSILFAVKSKLNAPQPEYVDTNPLISKSVDTESMILTLVPNDTKQLSFGQYRYDIQVTLADGTVDTVINNALLEIIPEVA